jgi:hypothetical protein
MEDMMAKTPKKAAPRKTVASADDAPETKRSTKDQQEAAEALFVGADGAVAPKSSTRTTFAGRPSATKWRRLFPFTMRQRLMSR